MSDTFAALIAKATTNKMSPKAGHTTSKAPKAKHPCDMAATAHITALLSRHQFIAGLVDFTSRQSLITKAMFRQPTNLDKFTPFDSIFLFSAPEQTIALMAKLCITAGVRATILTIPTELRLKIYEQAIEEHWEQHEDNHPPLMAFRIWDLKVKEPLEPSFLRTCKLFRDEGTGEYKKFLQRVCDAWQKKSADARRRKEEKARRERDQFPLGRSSTWNKLLGPGYCEEQDAAQRVDNAKSELKRLEEIERLAAVEKRMMTQGRMSIGGYGYLDWSIDSRPGRLLADTSDGKSLMVMGEQDTGVCHGQEGGPSLLIEFLVTSHDTSSSSSGHGE